MLRIAVLVVMVAVLAACSAHPADDAAARPASASTNALAGTPLATYGHDLNRAKNVQNIVNQQAQKQAAAIEAQSGSSAH